MHRFPEHRSNNTPKKVPAPVFSCGFLWFPMVGVLRFPTVSWNDDSPVSSNKPWFQPWFQSGANGFCPQHGFPTREPPALFPSGAQPHAEASVLQHPRRDVQLPGRGGGLCPRRLHRVHVKRSGSGTRLLELNKTASRSTRTRFKNDAFLI